MTRSALLRPAGPARPAVPTSVAVLTVAACALAVLAPALPASASADPKITSLSPTVTHVGRRVTLTGSGLDDPDTISVGSTPVDAATVTTTDGTSLSFLVPDGATTGAVAVTTRTGGSATWGSLEVDPAPTAVTGLSSSLGLRGLVLRWSGHGTGTTVVRAASDAAPGTTASGVGVPLTTVGTAYDKGFTNTARRYYSIFAVDADGTASPATALTVEPMAPLPSSLTLTASPTTVRPGVSSVLSGRLTRTTGGLPLGGAAVVVRRQTVGATGYVIVRTLTTAADGTARTSVVASRSSVYTLYYRGDAFSRGSLSTGRVVRVQPRVTAVLSPTAVVLEQSSALHGVVTPAYAGQTVFVQGYTGGSWHNLRSVTTTSTGAWTTSFAPRVGRFLYRAVLPATPAHLGATSASRLLQVAPRLLVVGNRGSDVLAVERALARLHYFTGPQDGYFDTRLKHAVIAFEKVERLARRGTWASAERSRVLAPRGFHVRYPSSGRAVEVDITRQVLVLSQGGSIVKIVDVSTGSENHYTQDGVDNIAHTPRGRFHITHKIDGIRVSKLGELYRPSYFFQGYAVHGNGSVPVYNASHGCVRVTDPVADYLFPLLTVGTPLAVYDE